MHQMLDNVLVKKAVHTDPDARRRRRREGELRAPRHRRWRLAAITLRALHRATSATTRPRPHWPNRDRFVLSCGHASMLLYSMLHLAGLRPAARRPQALPPVGLEDAGPPRVRHITPGVEITTGPLGQGISNAVGMAAGDQDARRALQRRRCRSSTTRVFGIASDGDLMEGVAARRPASRAHLGLDNLIFFYDDNQHHDRRPHRASRSPRTSGAATRPTAGSCSTSTATTTRRSARRSTRRSPSAGRPSLIVARTHIGIGSPNKQDSSQGARRAARRRRREGDASRRSAGRSSRPSTCPTRCARCSPSAPRRASASTRRGARRVDGVRGASGGEHAELVPQADGASEVPAEPVRGARRKAAPTKDGGDARARRRRSSRRAAALVPSLVGGSADLNPSTKTYIEGSPGDLRRASSRGATSTSASASTRMGAFVNGMARHRRLHPVRLDVPGLQRLHAPGDPPRGAHRSCSRSSSSRTTACTSARTARRTSRSSTTGRSA